MQRKCSVRGATTTGAAFAAWCAERAWTAQPLPHTNRKSTVNRAIHESMDPKAMDLEGEVEA